MVTRRDVELERQLTTQGDASARRVAIGCAIAAGEALRDAAGCMQRLEVALRALGLHARSPLVRLPEVKHGPRRWDAHTTAIVAAAVASKMPAKQAAAQLSTAGIRTRRGTAITGAWVSNMRLRAKEPR